MGFIRKILPFGGGDKKSEDPAPPPEAEALAYREAQVRRRARAAATGSPATTTQSAFRPVNQTVMTTNKTPLR